MRSADFQTSQIDRERARWDRAMDGVSDARHVERCVGFVRKRQPHLEWKYELFEAPCRVALLGWNEVTGVRHALMIPVAAPALRNKQDVEKEITCAGDDIAAWFRENEAAYIAKRMQAEGSGASAE